MGVPIQLLQASGCSGDCVVACTVAEALGSAMNDARTNLNVLILAASLLFYKLTAPKPRG